jgi:hypothetical protein
VGVVEVITVEAEPEREGGTRRKDRGVTILRLREISRGEKSAPVSKIGDVDFPERVGADLDVDPGERPAHGPPGGGTYSSDSKRKDHGDDDSFRPHGADPNFAFESARCLGTL